MLVSYLAVPFVSVFVQLFQLFNDKISANGKIFLYGQHSQSCENYHVIDVFASPKTKSHDKCVHIIQIITLHVLCDNRKNKPQSWYQNFS